MAKLASSSTSVPDKVSVGSCLFGIHFKISKFAPLTYGLGVQSIAFVLDLRVSEFPHWPFKSGISILYSSMILLVLFPIDFQNQMFWVLSFWCQPSGLGSLVWSTIPSFLEGVFHIFGIHLTCGGHFSWGGSWQGCVSNSFTFLHASLLSFVVEVLFI